MSYKYRCDKCGLEATTDARWMGYEDSCLCGGTFKDVTIEIKASGKDSRNSLLKAILIIVIVNLLLSLCPYAGCAGLFLSAIVG